MLVFTPRLMRKCLVPAGRGEVAVATELFVPLWRFVEESSVVALPDELYVPNRTISLLGDDDFGLSLELRFIFTSMVVAFAVDEHDDVRILLDRT